MTLLERIFGVETMARIREEARQAQARAAAPPPALRRTPQAPGRGDATRLAPSAASAPRRLEAVAPPSAGGFVDALPADFPTSILGTEVVAAPPLLAAFGSREALLAAIVYSEALAPPIGFR